LLAGAGVPVAGVLNYLRISLMDHDLASQAAGPLAWGDDYLAGGPDDDMIWAQLGDDVVQGDGDVDFRVNGAKVGAWRDASGYLHVLPSYEAPTDGDDYIEGGGGHDVVFGGLGADDIIGGSSSMFSLTTMARRPDDGDLLFGGAGTDVGRNDDTRGHLADSDVIVGDNGNILRVVVADSTVLTRAPWDQRSQRQALDLGLLLRVVVLLDYTEGGPDAMPQLFPGITQEAAAGAGTGVVDVWGSDEIHGESGDDAIYAGGGNDVVFADAGDDNVVGGWGHDWISGGTGSDVLHGDEAWSLLTTVGATATTTTTAFATAAATGERCVEPARPAFSNDVIFGGWDDDLLDGGWGDDALSGAEALEVSWAPDYAGGVLETGWNRPFNDGRLLGIDPVTGKFLLLNEKHPEYVITLNPDGTQVQIGWSKVKVPVDPTAFGSRGHCKPRFIWVKVWTPPSDLVWFLTNDPGDGRPVPGKHRSCAPVLFTDGDDALFGQDGRDWLVGGTGEDALWGGADSDLLNGDDDPWTDLGLNKHRDKADSYEDELIGGRGDDDYITNNSHDHITHGDGDLDPTALPSGSFARWPVLRQVPEEMEDTLKAMTRALGPQVVAVPFTDPVPEQLAAPTNGEVPLTWSPTFLEVPELAELGTPDRGKPGLGWGADDADEQLDCEDGGRAPACLLRVTTLLVTVGTTVTIPLSLQVVDVVENLAGRPGSQHDKGEGRGGHHDDGYRSAGADERHGGHGLGRVDEQPLSRENLAIVAVMAAGLSVLPVLEPVNQPASAAPVPSADPAAPVVQAAAWKPG
ncbi:MAG: calcium-binding protein, partial [Propionicimonas sp.]